MNKAYPIAAATACTAAIGALVYPWKEPVPDRVVCRVPIGLAGSEIDFLNSSKAPCLAFAGELPANDVVICTSGQDERGTDRQAEHIFDVDLSLCGPASDLLIKLEDEYGLSRKSCAQALAAQVKEPPRDRVNDGSDLFVGCRLLKVS